MKIREYLQNKIIICDGAFGTYYNSLTEGTLLPEKANVKEPEIVKKIHREYIKSGAVLIRTNTFASNMESLGCGEAQLKENLTLAYSHACEAAKLEGKIPGEDCFIAGDIGPISSGPAGDEDKNKEEYLLIGRSLLQAGAKTLIFETFSETEAVLGVIGKLKEENSDIFIILQFCVNQYGYSNAGISARRLANDACSCGNVDAVGFNCGVGPGHLLSIWEKLSLPESMILTALPNAGYPKLIQNRMVFRDNSAYFCEKMKMLSMLGIRILGGCCGTTPEYIKGLVKAVDLTCIKHRQIQYMPHKHQAQVKRDSSFFHNKGSKKLIAVEISPPPGADDEKVMEAAFTLKNLAVDVVTFPDSPSGRTRADSVLMAKKVSQETGLCVMPHICCRDKNAIAMRSQLLGAYINGIRNLLLITGDPVPTLIRREVKSVFNFDAVALMKIVQEMNYEEFAADPICFGGAVNQYRLNEDVEIKRVSKKMEQGADFFLTQPVFTKEDAQRVRRIKEATGARILCGIMPLISMKNALFIQNEMAGIQVGAETVGRFRPDMTREQGEEAGIGIARDVMKITESFSDGYYFSIPFNRVYLLNRILG